MKWILVLLSYIVSSMSITEIINTERRLYKLKPITYNYELEEDLSLYLETFGSSIIDEDILDYATFDNYKGYKFITKGEYRSSMKSNIRFRLSQRKCIDVKKCSSGKYDNYKSCIVDDFDRNCKHLWYPQYIVKSLSEIACIDIPRDQRYFCYGKADERKSDNPLTN